MHSANSAPAFVAPLSLRHRPPCLSAGRAAAPLCGRRPSSVRPAAVRVRPSACHGVVTGTGTDGIVAIVLAGGTGSRMRADRPKQLLQLRGQPILAHSISLFGSMREVSHVVVVLDEVHRPLFEAVAASQPCPVTWAMPGTERQDSVYNGLEAAPPGLRLACIHDAARPLVTQEAVRRVLHDAEVHGAAVLGVQSKATVKESEDGEFVLRTVPRSRLWEIQTPQVVRPELLKRGFEKVRAEGIDVTDDASIVEALGEPVKITVGDYSNIKITTPEDMSIAESILQQREHEAPAPV